MVPSTSFLVTEIPTVVHNKWRASTRCDLTCQYERQGRLRNTTSAASILRQHKSRRKPDGWPIQNLLPVKTFELIIFFQKLSLSVVVVEPNFFTVLVCVFSTKIVIYAPRYPVVPSSRYHQQTAHNTQTERNAHMREKGVFIVYHYHHFCADARFCENVSSILHKVVQYHGLCRAPYRRINTTRICSACKG